MIDVPNINRTVTIRLVGGLGNQMFQYAAALGLAVRQNRKLQLDLSSFKTYRTWPYLLDCLRLPQEIYAGPPLGAPVSNSLKDRVIRKLRGGYTLREGVYQEPHFHFDPAIYSLSSDEIFLDGYFQSPRYFKEVEDLLRERFQPKAPLTEAAASWAQKIIASPCSVSLHVRRGDYLAVAFSRIHCALDSRSYYDRAAALMQDLVGPKAEFFLFSDEPDYLAKAFSDLPRSHVVRADPSAPWEDMFLMTRCQHNIVANSTYSWWGAWLNSTQNKRVIAPAAWFTPETLTSCNVLDLYPNDWILLK